MKLLIVVLSLFCWPTVNAQFLPVKPASTHVEQRAVSIIEWSAFIRFMKTDPAFSPAYIRSMQPDYWSDNQLITRSLNNAVTGVSWQQALAYCEWRSTLATYLNTHSGVTAYQRMVADNERAKTIITYRLPTEKEWEKMAAGRAGSGSATRAETGFRCVYSIRRIA